MRELLGKASILLNQRSYMMKKGNQIEARGYRDGVFSSETTEKYDSAGHLLEKTRSGDNWRFQRDDEIQL